MTDTLSYGRQCVSEEDIEAVVRVLRSDWLTQGPTVEAFERALADRIGAQHVVACNSGTAALHLAAIAAGLGPGSCAVIPAVTFVATANAVRMTGAEVVFADVDPDTGRMTGASASAALDRAARDGHCVRALMPVHLGGAASEVMELRAAADSHGAIVIEDACHALGGSYECNGKPVSVGACADSAMACFSFHPVKPVTTGEGGAVSTNDAGFADHMRQLRSHGITREQERFRNCSEALDTNGEVNPWYYEVPEIGWNYRISDIQCALGLSQLGRLYEFRKRREALTQRYRELLAPLAPIVQAVPESPGVKSGHHLFVVLIDFEKIGTTRAQVMRELRKRGVGTQVHYIPVPWQPYYTDRYGKTDYPGAASYYNRCLSLPLFAAMNESDVSRIVQILTDVLKLR